MIGSPAVGKCVIVPKESLPQGFQGNGAISRLPRNRNDAVAISEMPDEVLVTSDSPRRKRAVGNPEDDHKMVRKLKLPAFLNRQLPAKSYTGVLWNS